MRDEFERALAMFGEICDLSPQEQRERLRTIAEEDPALGARVESLLAADADADARFEQEARDFVSLTPETPGASSAEAAARLVKRLATPRVSRERYQTGAELGRGGMGQVLEAWDADFERSLAMKVLGAHPASSPDGDPEKLVRFLEEAKVTGQLDHPGIVPVHELGLDSEGRLFFTMKLVQGRTLEEVLDLISRGGEGWTRMRALGVLVRVCEAMAYAHEKGVVHRDLKPANVMVGRFGEVYVMDWGVARVLGTPDAHDLRPRPPEATVASHQEADSPVLTMDGTVLGTPYYMPPEQAAGRIDALDARSDVYAMGAILYQLLTGHPPYRDERRPSPHAVLARVLREAPAPVAASGNPAELIAVCERAMARDPDERYPDMGALARDLSAFVEGRVVAAYETGAVAELRKWVKRNKALASSLAAAALLLVVGLSASLLLKAQADANARDAKAQEELARENSKEAEEQARIADANAQEARLQTRIAQRRAEDVFTLSAFQILEDLTAEMDTFWPPQPQYLDDYDRWLAEAAELVSGLEPDPTSNDVGHRRRLEALREKAPPRTDAERDLDRREHPLHDELASARRSLAAVEASTERRQRKGLSPQEEEMLQARLDAARERVARLEEEVDQPWRWRFADEQRRWWHNQLEKLIAAIEGFADPQTGLIEGISAEHGWGIARRREWAATVEERTISGHEAASRWASALARLRENDAYAGVQLEPQLGLVPLGPDPESGLEEFGHLLTGDVTERGEDGRLLLTEESGLVFVFLPGGQFWMGAQADDPGGRNYDPKAQIDEGPVHSVILSPFFLSKYEMTQGQWLRFVGHNPSTYQPPGSLAPSLLHPVEQVSWSTCMLICERLGLSLPSEAQWEYGARAGTDSVWWTGNERESLRTAVNLADRAAVRAGAPWVETEDWPDLDDTFAAHAPVAEYRPNPFGLHNVHGNVWEWCLDGYNSGPYAPSWDQDPVRDPASATTRVDRGGCFNGSAFLARSAARGFASPDDADDSLGLRPVRAVDGPYK